MENLQLISLTYKNNYSANHYNCQHLNREIREQPATSPHAAGEYCSDCGRWLRWISKREYYSNSNHNSRLNGGLK